MKKFLIIAVIIIAAGAVLYYGMEGKDKLAQIMPSPDGESSEENDETNVEPDEVFAQPITYSSLNQTYTGSRFSFKYSEGFKVSSALVGEGAGSGEMVTIENPKGSGFQMFIYAFDESGPITPERILQDMPDMEINDPKNADLDGSKTLVFNGYDEDFGETFEAWTVHGGKLYEITGPKVAEQLMIETLETWAWKK